MFRLPYQFYGLSTLNRSALRRHGACLLVSAAATGTQLVLQAFAHATFPYVPAIAAVVFAAWFGGLAPAVLAAICAGAGSTFLMLQPPYALRVHASIDWANIGLYLAACTIIFLINASVRRQLRRASDDLARRQHAEEQLRFDLAHSRITNDSIRKRLEQAESERKRLEVSLGASEERMQVAQTAAHFALFDWDLGKQAIFVAGDLSSIFGITADQWYGYESWRACVHAEDRPELEKEITGVLQQGRDLNLEFRVVWPDETLHWIIAKGSPYRDNAGRLQRVIGIYQDITAQKQTEEALIRNEKLAAAGKLAATIAHEINNPLAAVMNLLYIVRNDRTLSQAGAQYLSLAEQELRRVAQLARQSLGFYKDTSEPTRIRLSEVLNEVLSFYGRNMPGSIEVVRRFGPEVEIYGHRGELWQVFANLISNAVYALKQGGTLTVETHLCKRSHENGVEVRFQDTGPGIRREHLDRLFEPFFTTKLELGVGLGLWIVKEIVGKHGGSIEVESSTEADKHGTCFSIVLPVAATSNLSRSSAA